MFLCLDIFALRTNDSDLTFFRSLRLVKMTYTLHILANMAPNAVVNPREASHILAWQLAEYRPGDTRLPSNPNRNTDKYMVMHPITMVLFKRGLDIWMYLSRKVKMCNWTAIISLIVQGKVNVFTVLAVKSGAGTFVRAKLNWKVLVKSRVHVS